MADRTHWKVVEILCQPSRARIAWDDARARGATGAVTSWGSGIAHRATLRLYWEVGGSGSRALPPDVAELAEDLVEEDWTPFWKESLTAFAVSDNVVLAPAWEEESDPVDGQLRLRIDPGMAFGAGDHPTTRLCVRLIERLARDNALPELILDVGAGTGVLGFVAARLGESQVDALDIDPFCYASCRRNARRNRLLGRVRPLLLSLDLLDNSYPLVLANIVTKQLVDLAPRIHDRVVPGGRMVLSGFETKDETQILNTVAPGFDLEVRLQEEGWVALQVKAPQ